MDDVPLNRFHIRIAGLTFGAHFIDGYILGLIGFALIQLKPIWHLHHYGRDYSDQPR